VAEIRDIDKRMNTRKGSIRIQTWVDPKTGEITSYAMAYINHNLTSVDNGRVVGFDNRDQHSDFGSKHHYHWFGTVHENVDHASYDLAKERFQRFLKRLKQQHARNY
jgi:hypothetical protein